MYFFPNANGITEKLSKVTPLHYIKWISLGSKRRTEVANFFVSVTQESEKKPYTVSSSDV